MFLKMIYSILLILFSINVLSHHLEQNLSIRYMNRFSNNIYTMFLLGIIVTFLTQSSTAITALTICLLKSNKINLKSAVSIVLGSNIGTSFTPLITGISFINFYLFFIIGFIIYMFKKHKSIGLLFIYISFLFLGLSTLKDSLITVKENINLSNYFIHYNKYTLYSYFGGILFSFLLQSSNIVIVIVQQLGSLHILSLLSSFCIVLGANVGTTISGLILSLTSNRETRILALSNLLVNLVGSLIAMPILNVLNIYIINSIELTLSIFQITFNIVSSVLGLIFMNHLIVFASMFVKKKTD